MMRDKLDKNKKIQKELANVYAADDGKLPDFSKLDRGQRPVWKSTLYVLIFVFSILLMFSTGIFWFLSVLNKDNFTNEQISLKIEPPILLVSGQDATYTVMVTNKENVNVYNTKVEIIYPENFQFTSSSPAAKGDKQNNWNFSVLRVGETEKITFTGKIVGDINSMQNFKGIVTFRPANMNADFKQESILETTISSSVVSLSIEGPDKVMPSDDVNYIIKYKNLGLTDLQDLQVIVQYPPDFVYASSEPAALKDKNNTWEIAKLSSSTEGQIKIKGNYAIAKGAESQEIKAQILLKYNGNHYIQKEELFTTNVVKDLLTLQMVINGSAQDQPIGFGSMMTYSLSYKNDSQQAMDNVQLIAKLDSQILDWETFSDQSNGVISGNTITWTKEQIAKLSRLAPGDGGTINWQLKLKDASAVNDRSVNKFSVESSIQGVFSQGTGLETNTIVNGKTIINSINSDLNISAAARYYSDDNMPLGSGPITPKIKEKSGFNIKLALSNNLNNVSDVRIVATLPKNVQWAQKENHDIGDLIFDSRSNKVTWIINKLDKNLKQTEADFNLNITPTANDLGRVLVLISDITLTAKDTGTGTVINKSIKAITTSFDDPILGKVDGVVE